MNEWIERTNNMSWARATQLFDESILPSSSDTQGFDNDDDRSTSNRHILHTRGEGAATLAAIVLAVDVVDTDNNSMFDIGWPTAHNSPQTRYSSPSNSTGIPNPSTHWRQIHHVRFALPLVVAVAEKRAIIVIVPHLNNKFVGSVVLESVGPAYKRVAQGLFSRSKVLTSVT